MPCIYRRERLKLVLWAHSYYICEACGTILLGDDTLYDKGILLSIDQFSPRQFDRIDFVISSNQVGVFTLEVHNLNMGTSNLMASADLRMDDLLHAQFEDKVTLALFDGMAKMNLNLLLYQINKK